MKNYLFAPFKDDEDKKTTWESCKCGMEYGIMIFLGRLESTYDVIISDLKSKCAIAVADERIIKELRAELNASIITNERLEKELKQTNKDYNHDMKVHEEFSDKQDDIIVKLKQDIKEFEKEIKIKDKQYHMLASSKTKEYLGSGNKGNL
jgi:predicted RNase H-like nuclease (RuvC/YqgF family)